MSVSCTHSESQKKLLSSNVNRRFDSISSSNDAPSDLARQGRESVKIQVNTPSLHPQAAKATSVRLQSSRRWPCIPQGCAQIPIQEWLLCLCCGPSSPVGVFDYFFKCIWTITADYP